MAQHAAALFYPGLDQHDLINRSGQGFYRDDMVSIFRSLQSLGYQLYVINASESERQLMESRIPADIQLNFIVPDINSLSVASFAVSNYHTNQMIPLTAVYTYDTVIPRKPQPTPDELLDQLAVLLNTDKSRIYLVGSGYTNAITEDNLGLVNSGNYINIRPGEVGAAGQLALHHAQINGIDGDIDTVYTDADYDIRDQDFIKLMFNINYHPLAGQKATPVT